MNRSRRHDKTAAEKLELLNRYIFCRINTEKILHFVHFRKRRLLKPPRIKSKTGSPEVDLLTEFHCKCLLCIRSSSAVGLFNDLTVLESSNMLLNKESLLMLKYTLYQSSFFTIISFITFCTTKNNMISMTFTRLLHRYNVDCRRRDSK